MWLTIEADFLLAPQPHLKLIIVDYTPKDCGYLMVVCRDHVTESLSTAFPSFTFPCFHETSRGIIQYYSSLVLQIFNYPN